MLISNNEGKGASPVDETDEILAEMESEGIPTVASDDSESQRQAEEDDDADAAAKGKSEDDEEDEEDEPDEEDEEDDDTDSDDEEDEDEEDEAEDDEDEEEESPAPKAKTKQPNRTPKVIPVWEHKKELRQQEKRLRKELTTAAQNAPTDGFDSDSDEVKAIVAEFGMDSDKGAKFVTSLLNAAAKKVSKEIPIDDIKRLREQIQDTEEETKFQKELRSVDKEIKSLYGDVSSKRRERITAQLRELAYTPKYKTYRLVDILRLHRDQLAPKTKKKTGEGPGTRGGKVSTVSRINLDDPNSIDWGALSDEEFEEVSNKLGEKEPKHKITRRRR